MDEFNTAKRIYLGFLDKIDKYLFGIHEKEIPPHFYSKNRDIDHFYITSFCIISIVKR